MPRKFLRCDTVAMVTVAMVTVTMVTDIPAGGKVQVDCDREGKTRGEDGRGEKGERQEVPAGATSVI